jgi:hypothetical protein
MWETQKHANGSKPKTAKKLNVDTAMERGTTKVYHRIQKGTSTKWQKAENAKVWT